MTATAGERVAVFFMNGIGDHLMVLPALRALAAIFAGRLTYFGQAQGIALLRDELPDVECVALPWSRTASGAYAIDAIGQAAARAPFALALSLVPWENASLRALLAALKPRQTLGLTPGCDRMIDYRAGEHTADRAFRAVQAVRPELRIESFAVVPATRSLGGRRRLRRGRRNVLAVHNETLHSKTWPAARMRALLAAFSARHRAWQVIGVGRTDFGLYGGGRIGPRNPPRGLRAAFRSVARADAFLGVDSCMLHLADLHRVPAIALFGPAGDAPLGPRAMGLRWTRGVHCVGAGSMAALSLPRVRHALLRLTRDIERRKRASLPRRSKSC